MEVSPTESLYEKGSKVWIPHVNKIWEQAEILEGYNGDTKQIVIETESNREIKTLIIKSVSDLPPLCCLEDFLIDEKKNLASLKILHEASILNTLQLRFENRCIYSHCGVVTIFLNPFLKPIQSEGYNIFSYRGQVIDNLKPHIFAVAERTYCRLERENHDQSIIFTGKSAAGKTENARQAILYLATVSAKENQIKENILASLIILKSFGNAKTTSNDNSSRFGNFIELQYSPDYHVIGASITTFLLDRSRVVHQIKNEQNFHVFYELCSANDHFPHLQLTEKEFRYLNKSASAEIRIDYCKQFVALLDAFNAIRFPVKQQGEIFQILAAILHLGNLNFKKCDILGINEKTESCFISGLAQLEILASVFSLDVKSVKPMRKWMCHKRIFSGQNEILQPMSVKEAEKACAALAMFLYTKLFIWIVSKINFFFLRSPCNVLSFIGILDLYGFEKLDVNLFEQFCINYANEKIHQNFIQLVFKLEQEEYLREDIRWNFMRYQDNRLCIELIEGKCGIIDILEEETKESKDDRIPWILNAYDRCEKSKYFKRPASHSTDFIIHHFIDYVQYDSSEFLEKNRDLIFREHLSILKDTKNEILHKLVTDEYQKTGLPKEKKRSRRKSRVLLNINQTKKMVISEFRKSLVALTSTLKNTAAHYVRCIKSNDEGMPYKFDPACIAQQIRAYNILDTIQISSMGYFSRQTYAEFFHRYYCLCQFDQIKRNDLEESCRMIVDAHIENSINVKFGKTKIFLKDESIAYLEKLRQEKQHRASVTIQKIVRRFLQQKRYQGIKCTVIGLQNQARKYLISRRAREITENRAALKIQTWARKWICQRQKQRLERINLALQNYAKFHLERKNVVMDDAEVIETAAIDIQRLFRGFMARRIREKKLRDIIIMQACVRRFLAKIAADKLRKGRVERIQLFNKGLETKINVLQQKLHTYVEKNITIEDLEEVEAIVDDQQCNQAKNRILNQFFFNKIQTLKSLGEKKVKNGDMSVINEKSLYEESRKVNQNSLNEVFKPLIQEEEEFTLYKPLFQAYFNFDQRIEKCMDAFGFSESELCSSRFIDTTNEGDSPNSQLLTNEEIIHYEGMFQLNLSDINLLLTRLVIELHSSLINEQEPRVPSRILFMCLRYIDSLRDLNSAFLMIENYIKAVKYVIKQRGDLETIFVWLVNTYQLLNYLKQYSRMRNSICAKFHAFNNDRQTEQCLVNLDLNMCWESLLELSQWLVRTAQKLMKTTISELTLLAILQFNPIPASSSENFDEGREQGGNVEAEMQDDKVEMEVTVNDAAEIEPQLQVQEHDQEQELQSKDQKEERYNALIEDEVQNQTFIQKQESIQEQAQENKSIQEQINKETLIQKFSNSENVNVDHKEEAHIDSKMEGNKVEMEVTVNDAAEIKPQLQIQEHNQEQELQFKDQKQSIQEQVQDQAFIQKQLKEQKSTQEQAQEKEMIQEHAEKEESTQKQVKEQETIQEQVEKKEPTKKSALNQVHQIFVEGEQNEEEERLFENNNNEHFFNSKRDMLLQKLTDFQLIMRRCGVEPKMMLQMFQQLFDFMSTILLSNIISRPELCNCYRGSLARLNLSIIDKWASHNELTVATVALGPIKQAMRLLQMQPMDDDDVYWISRFYEKLNCNQIMKILSCYKPAYTVDKLLSPNIMQKLHLRLAIRQEHENTVLIDSEEYPVSYPFRYCSFKLEEVEIPVTFNLPMLRKI